MARFLLRCVGGLFAALVCTFTCNDASAQSSNWVKTGVTGRLIYVPDAEGDRIPDFSMVGYGAGKRDIPGDIPVVIHIDPIAGDNTQHIQNAINLAATRPLQANGFRGVVELGPGKFDVNGQLSITASGVVLRGAGGGDSLASNTHIVAQNRTGTVGSTPVINIQGSSSGISRGPQIQIIDKVVPVGAQSFRVASTAGMTVGSMVEVFRPSTQAWIEELGMHLIPPDDMGNPRNWSAGDRNLDWQRTITRIEGNRIFIDAPITTALDQEWGGGTVRTYNAPNVIRNVGVENLRGQSLDAREEANESRTPTFIRFSRVVDGFARDLQTRHFTYASVFTSEADGGRHITVDNVHSRLPAGEVTGGRRYTFAMDGQYSLVQNSSADSGRHDFVTGSDVVGPIVFANSTTTTTRSDSGPHHRWGNGLLFDKLDINGNAINVQNRWTSGSGHGWAGANVVVWNSEANSFIMHAPPTANGWIVGSTGTINSGNCHLPAGVSCQGYRDSHGTRVIVGGEDSLYQAQKNEAADIREFHWTASSGNWNENLKWDQEIRPGVYTVSTREYLHGDYDNFTFDSAAGSVDTPPIDPAWQAGIVADSTNPIRGTDVIAANQNVAFTMNYQLVRGERVVHSYLAMSLKQSGDDVSRDSMQLFDTDPVHRLPFAALGWAPQINASTPFVGVIDLGPYLDELQRGAVNLQLSDDVAMDWALHTVTVATPKSDGTRPRVFIDRGNMHVTTHEARAEFLQNGGPAASQLTIAPTGRVTVDGDYVQMPNGTLAIGIGGVGTSQFGSLAVGDVAMLAGTLKLELAGAFVPSAGDSFQLVSAAAGFMGSTFGGAMLPTLPGDLSWQVMYSANAVMANVLGTVIVGDLNGDAQITPADWSQFKAGQGSSFAGLTRIEAFAKGDLDGDFDHDLADFLVFRVAYNNAHGAGAFAALVGEVPEPGSIVLLMCAAATALLTRNRARRRVPLQACPAVPPSVNLAACTTTKLLVTSWSDTITIRVTATN
jgi:hypothetical protein